MCIVPEMLVTRFPSIPVRYSCCVLRRLNYGDSFWGSGALPIGILGAVAVGFSRRRRVVVPATLGFLPCEGLLQQSAGET